MCSPWRHTGPGPTPARGRRRGPPASLASVETSRETVGSEATGPKTSGAPRSTAISGRQSPPRSRETATSSRISPGHALRPAYATAPTPATGSGPYERRQSCRTAARTAGPHRMGQGPRPRPGGVATDTWVQPDRLPHQKGAPPTRRSWPSRSQIICSSGALSSFSAVRLTISMKEPG
jgi:hypothetical protein